MERTFRLCPYLVCGQIEIGMDKDGTLQDDIISCEDAAQQVLMCSVCVSVCVSVLKLKFYSFLASTTFHNSL